MINKLLSKELFVIAFALMTIKNTILPATFGDALIFIAICGLYGYRMFLNSKVQVDVNAKVKEDLNDLRASLSALSVKQTISKPVAGQRLF